jgi:hypothetical protein
MDRSKASIRSVKRPPVQLDIRVKVRTDAAEIVKYNTRIRVVASTVEALLH